MSTHKWIASIPYSEAVVLHALTQELETKLLIESDVIWLRGEAESEEALSKVNRTLREIPDAERFRLVDDHQLQPIDLRLPTRLIPEGKWQSARNLLSVQLPPAGLAGSNSSSVQIQIVRGSSELANARQTPTILECAFDVFYAWATRTSEARLEFLSFACDQSGSVIVHGQPLPHLQGVQWIKYGQVAVPAGYSWQPSLSVKTLNKVVSPQQDVIHLLDQKSNRIVRLSSFVKATRSSVRQTAVAIGAMP